LTTNFVFNTFVWSTRLRHEVLTLSLPNNWKLTLIRFGRKKINGFQSLQPWGAGWGGSLYTHSLFLKEFLWLISNRPILLHLKLMSVPHVLWRIIRRFAGLKSCLRLNVQLRMYLIYLNTVNAISNVDPNSEHVRLGSHKW